MRRFRSAVAFAAVLVLLAVGAATWWPSGPGSDRPDPGIAPRSRPRAREVRARTAAMGRLTIPAIGVRADVVTLGLNGDGTLQVPARSEQTGWWKGGAYPGRPGAAVIAGHVDTRAGPAVFFGLRRLRAGDEVRFQAPGRAPARFVVQGSERTPKNRFPTRRVYGATRGSTLRLITCTGTFDRAGGHYKSNLIVYAHAAGPPNGVASRSQ